MLLWLKETYGCEVVCYCADVGQGDREEINAVATTAAGLNYGWPITEGMHCFPESARCDASPYVAPVAEYPRSGGCSVTGGYVYRGQAIPQFQGVYFFADFLRAWLTHCVENVPVYQWHATRRQALRRSGL